MAKLHVRDLMHAPVVNISLDTTLPDIEQQFVSAHVDCLPVMDHGGVVGIVTSGDLRHVQTSSVPQLRKYECPALLQQLNAQELMSHPVVTIAATAPLTEAARLMLIHRIRCLPVLRGRQLVGIITANDILHALIEPVALHSLTSN